jgi:hypothetical protein
MDRTYRHVGGGAALLGGLSLIAFVLLKEWVLPGWGPLLVFDDGTGLVFHFSENVPFGLIVVGLAGLLVALQADGWDLADAGAVLALCGAATALVAHTLEHVFFAFLGSELGHLFMWLYYLSLGLLALGLTVVGLQAGGRSVLGGRGRLVLVAVLPAAVAAAAVLGLLWFRAFADGFKLPIAVGMLVVGYRLLRPPQVLEHLAGASETEVSA